jgi:hypothetical protein
MMGCPGRVDRSHGSGRTSLRPRRRRYPRPGYGAEPVDVHLERGIEASRSQGLPDRLGPGINRPDDARCADDQPARPSTPAMAGGRARSLMTRQMGGGKTQGRRVESLNPRNSHDCRVTEPSWRGTLIGVLPFCSPPREISTRPQGCLAQFFERQRLAIQPIMEPSDLAATLSSQSRWLA